MGSHGTAHLPYSPQAMTPQSYQPYPHGGHVGMPQTAATALPSIRQTRSSTQSTQRLSMPYQPQVKVPKSVSFGKGVIPAGAESSYINQPTYAGKVSQPHPQGRESRRDVYERKTPSTSYSALRKREKEASQRPPSQPATPTSTTLSP